MTCHMTCLVHVQYDRPATPACDIDEAMHIYMHVRAFTLQPAACCWIWTCDVIDVSLCRRSHRVHAPLHPCCSMLTFSTHVRTIFCSSVTCIMGSSSSKPASEWNRVAMMDRELHTTCKQGSHGHAHTQIMISSQHTAHNNEQPRTSARVASCRHHNFVQTLCDMHHNACMLHAMMHASSHLMCVERS